MKILKCEITKDENGFWIATVDGKEVTKQSNIVAASKKLHNYLKGQN